MNERVNLKVEYKHLILMEINKYMTFYSKHCPKSVFTIIL